ncbi:hypothetical protein FN846DRAFT_986980 [Sphaerosporella brunnea]|uniref:Major facilitator superfamily domain-containing protein n=1 Tax=Sphaerosporella brunnea TaxID=1250544 RepID=A0A5J5ESI1_9PEZI|nr:hypothetical protein FN846DRAFT_986980 [Sphaerosporella brunnea]
MRPEPSVPNAESVACAGTTEPMSAAPDPFGFEGTAACSDAVRRFNAALSKRKRLKEGEHTCQKCRWLVSATAGTARLISSKPRVIGWNSEHNRVAGSDPEEMGARNAAGMTKSWTRPELIACYVLLVLLTNLLHLCAVLYPGAVRNALSDLSCNSVVNSWTCDLPWYLLEISGMTAPTMFAKIANSYSRPWSLFLSSLFCVSGLAIAFPSRSIEIYTVGTVLMDFGLQGLLTVVAIIVADSSDLKSRAFYLWWCHCTRAAWLWCVPWIEPALASWGDNSTNWRNATMIFFGGVTAFTIPNAMALYIYIRRAEAQGYIHQSHRQYSWTIWKPQSLLDNLKNFSARNDLLGTLTWSLGLAFLTAPLICTSWYHQGSWTSISVAVGCFLILVFVIWELYLGGTFSDDDGHWGSSPPETGQQRGQSISNPAQSSSPSRPVITVACPAVTTGEDLEALAAHTYARLKRREDGHSFRDVCDAFLPGSLFQTSQVALPIFCACLETFARLIASWILISAPATSTDIDWQTVLSQISTTCATFSAFVVAWCITAWQRLPIFIAVGLLVELLSCLIMLEGCFGRTVALQSLYLPHILLGLGAGMVDISLLVAAQSGCIRRGDVATATGLCLALKALAGLLARALGRAIEKYYAPLTAIDILRSVSQAIDVREPVRMVWGTTVIAAIFAFAIAFATTVAAIQNDDLTARKQHVTGTVFGEPDESVSDGEEWRIPVDGTADPSGSGEDDYATAPLQIGPS